MSIILGFVSLQTFIGAGHLKLSQFNVEILLVSNLILFCLLIISIAIKIQKNYQKKKSKEIGGETSRNLVLYFLLI